MGCLQKENASFWISPVLQAWSRKWSHGSSIGRLKLTLVTFWALKVHEGRGDKRLTHNTWNLGDQLWSFTRKKETIKQDQGIVSGNNLCAVCTISYSLAQITASASQCGPAWLQTRKQLLSSSASPLHSAAEKSGVSDGKSAALSCSPRSILLHEKHGTFGWILYSSGCWPGSVREAGRE